jgi:hypothetical protein
MAGLWDDTRAQKQRPPHWTPPSIFRLPEVLTEVEVIEAEAELKAHDHALRLSTWLQIWSGTIIDIFGFVP